MPVGGAISMYTQEVEAMGQIPQKKTIESDTMPPIGEKDQDIQTRWKDMQQTKEETFYYVGKRVLGIQWRLNAPHSSCLRFAQSEGASP